MIRNERDQKRLDHHTARKHLWPCVIGKSRAYDSPCLNEPHLALEEDRGTPLLAMLRNGSGRNCTCFVVDVTSKLNLSESVTCRCKAQGIEPAISRSDALLVGLPRVTVHAADPSSLTRQTDQPPQCQPLPLLVLPSCRPFSQSPTRQSSRGVDSRRSDCVANP